MLIPKPAVAFSSTFGYNPLTITQHTPESILGPYRRRRKHGERKRRAADEGERLTPTVGRPWADPSGSSTTRWPPEPPWWANYSSTASTLVDDGE